MRLMLMSDRALLLASFGWRPFPKEMRRSDFYPSIIALDPVLADSHTA